MSDSTFVEHGEHSVRTALARGWKGRCPSCGTGKIFHRYLKVCDACPSCGQVLSHHRADDGPAYLTILLVGHVMGPLLLYTFVHLRPDPWALALAFSIGSVAASLYLLPRIKGAMIGFQWAKGMHGFGSMRGA